MSNIVCGKDMRANVERALSLCAFTVTDSNVAALYPEYTKNAFVFAAGEKSKTPQTLFTILDAMTKRGLKRGDCIAAVGGGVVGDITGLAAALYMRGIDWVNIPTTLLAMVDSGIGGKTAVDFDGVKNLVGAFHMPRDIVISADFLRTLPEREWVCGMGELIKTCLLTEAAYDELKSKKDALLSKNASDVCELIELCVAIKNAVVAADPKEKNLRKILNVGHTVGHALESLDGYKLSHGEYVIKGMMTEIAMCKDIVDEEFYGEIISLLKMFTSPPRTTGRAVRQKAAMDKKNEGNTVTVMLPRSPAEIIEVKMELADFLARYDAALKELKER
ncbi:MAG: 3-dehydroquinate synthase [Roseburia sp.]|nr:3-dehydroquinate synthase [Roseburia sp.]